MVMLKCVINGVDILIYFMIDKLQLMLYEFVDMLVEKVGNVEVLMWEILLVMVDNLVV